MLLGLPNERNHICLSWLGKAFGEGVGEKFLKKEIKISVSRDERPFKSRK